MLKIKIFPRLFLNRINKNKQRSFRNAAVYEDQVKEEDKEFSLKTIESYSLNKNIRNLEFINYLEMNLQDKQLNNFPLEFFTDLKTLKHHSQNNLLTTLHSISLFE
ncbi:hypothetical protein [Lacinutrix himadriensis]|uniref:hypothetical protein n=1 Tax=Lacinutrix himadriensis TaxID=641549 RepID=UPI0006E34B29|nr:hypothetical protein [Lacinutrix himadriensis]